MTILIDQNSRIIVQGIVGRAGSYFSRRMHDYGQNVVGGVAPGYGGDWALDSKVPIFDTVHECFKSTDADTSVIFVPPHAAADACFEALDAGIQNVICVSDGVPRKDTALINSRLSNQKTRLIGPNASGVFSPGKALAGIFPVERAIAGRIGVISRAGSLAFSVLDALYEHGLGVRTVIGLGEYCLAGAGFVECLDIFEMDAHTDSILLIGQPGDVQEEVAAVHILESITKPVYAYIAGESLAKLNLIGHTEMGMFDTQHSSQSKIEALSDAGVLIAKSVEAIPNLLKK